MAGGGARPIPARYRGEVGQRRRLELDGNVGSRFGAQRRMGVTVNGFSMAETSGQRGTATVGRSSARRRRTSGRGGVWSSSGGPGGDGWTGGGREPAVDSELLVDGEVASSGVSTPAMARSGKRRGMAAVAGSRVPTMAAPAARSPDGAVPGRLLRRGGGEGELGASLSGFSCRAQNRGNG
jgi:hypothetical protein